LVLFKIKTCYNTPSAVMRGFGGFVTFIYLSVIFNGGLESKAGETRTTAMAGPLQIRRFFRKGKLLLFF